LNLNNHSVFAIFVTVMRELLTNKKPTEVIEGGILRNLTRRNVKKYVVGNDLL